MLIREKAEINALAGPLGGIVTNNNHLCITIHNHLVSFGIIYN